MATNFVKASFQEIYDLHTNTNTSTILGVHTPISTRVHQYLHGFFEQYKQFRYDGCSMVFIPVSQLPVDPLQVGTEAGYVDPRDLVNPILHCGMHGESLGNTLEGMFNLDLNKSIYDGLDVVERLESTFPEEAHKLEQMYYTALASPSFQKAHVQKGFRKGRLVPLAYQMQTNRQLMPSYLTHPYYVTGSGNADTDPLGPEDNVPETYAYNSLQTKGWSSNLGHAENSDEQEFIHNIGQVVYTNGSYTNNNQNAGQIFAGNLRRLGWLDTLQSNTRPRSEYTELMGGSMWTALPKLYMYLVMLPPCYMQKMYFRVVLTHHYSFRNFRASKGPFALESISVQAYNGPPLDGTQVTPDLGSPYEPATATTVSDTMTVVNGAAELITDGVS